jgi:hypothetical protein
MFLVFYHILPINIKKERTGSAWNPVPEGGTNYCSLTFSAGLPLINTSFSIHLNYKNDGLFSTWFNRTIPLSALIGFTTYKAGSDLRHTPHFKMWSDVTERLG